MIHKEDAINDLTNWTTFALAGRTQKPVLSVLSDPDIEKAMETNRRQAMSLALFLNFHNPGPLSLGTQLLPQICDFSYQGDIRMRWKMENPNKVKNIVEGQEERLRDVYEPIVKEMETQGLVRIEKDGERISSLRVVQTESNLQHMFSSGLPPVLKEGMKGSVKQLSLEELQGDVQKNLLRLVYGTSVKMVLSGLYSTNPLKGLAYLGEKFKKGRAK